MSVVRAVQFANPVTGEVLTLDSPTEDLGGYLADIREHESVLREHKAMVNRELLARLDKRRKWTLPLGNGLKISAPSDEPGEEFDAEGLYWALRKLVREGELAAEAVSAAVELVPVQYKAKAAGIKALRKNPELAKVVDEFARPVEKPRYVKVSRDG